MGNGNAHHSRPNAAAPRDAARSLLPMVRDERGAVTWSDAVVWGLLTRRTRGRRYSALKTLSEKKACFNEYVQARKVQEVAEKRAAIKQAREDFADLLQGCADLKPGTRFSRASALLDDDPRWRVRSCCTADAQVLRRRSVVQAPLEGSQPVYSAWEV